MIKTLRKKIVLITLLSVGLVLLVMVIGMNIASYRQLVNEADETLNLLAQNGGRFPGNMDPNRPMRPEAQFDTRYFSVLFDEEASVQMVDLRQIFAVSKEQAITYATEVLLSGHNTGFISHYRFMLYQEKTDQRVIFVDVERSLNAFYTNLSNSILISIVGIAAVAGLAFVFSRILLRPVEEAYYKQRQFITDASHELKTPLTIIKANMDVLELTQEKNKWIESTQHQSDRMAVMVNDLLFLAKMDETEKHLNWQKLDVRVILEEVLSDYQPMLDERFKLELDVETVEVKTDPDLIKRLFNVLVENTLRYGIVHGTVRIELQALKGHRMRFKITNQASLSHTGNLNELFDRFKRLDEARNQAHGGSGIGLSIAKSIVDLHEGKIEAYSRDGKSFTITIEL